MKFLKKQKKKKKKKKMNPMKHKIIRCFIP